MGFGELAELFSEMDEIERVERRVYRRKWTEEQEEIRSLDLEIARFNITIMDLVTATILVSGYHPHKGQWRRLRNAK